MKNHKSAVLGENASGVVSVADALRHGSKWITQMLPVMCSTMSHKVEAEF